ncbi:MAG: radical SAM family heme chaperone HemW [Acidobacteria bacterium]|nr:radical SAM family heme chaperone HemW [Acidobacteriota bacterium]
MPGVYISYPFCAQKCTYCNFASGVFPRQLEQDYLGALLLELGRVRWQWTPETIYFGGGTPSLIPAPVLRGILAQMPGFPWREATMEAAPGGITADLAAAWREAGINRVSLGVQSLVEPEIRRTGRKHTPDIVSQEVALLRAEGIERVNIDLIAGLPGQTAESWALTLDRLEALHPDHASVYMLEVDEDSRLGNEILLGGVRYGARDVPDDDNTARFYETAVDRLAAMGVPRYEISNFARPGHESVHNLKYWRREPYLGLGSDAHSFDGRWRWRTPETPAEYVKLVREGASTVMEREEADEAEERFFLGLRLDEGIAAEPDAIAPHGEVLERLAAAGLVETTSQRLRLTRRGVLVSNEVFQEFIR